MKKIAIALLGLLISLPMSVLPVMASDTFTSAQVAQHNTAADCWMVVNSNVYDLTNFIPTFTGPSITSACGADGTTLFNNMPNPAGVINLINPFLIGSLTTLTLTSVAVTPSTPSLVTGGTLQLTATPLDQNGATFSTASTTFLSNNAAVATVSTSTGLVTGISQGTAVITATSASASSTVSGISTVTVTASSSSPVLTNVTLSPNNSIIDVGSTEQLTATAVDQNGLSIASTTFSFAASNTAVATVSSTTGLVTAVSVGTTTVTVTGATASTTLSASVNIKVVPVPVLTNVIVTPTTTALLTGTTQQLRVSTTDQTNAPIAATLSFSSGNPTIASVNSSGLINALAVGTSTITVTAVNASTTIPQTVNVTNTLGPVNLGTASNFAILSKTGITSTSTTSILGNIGTSPGLGSTISGLTSSQVTGSIFTVDGTGPAGSISSSTVPTTAVTDMTTAYTNASAMPAGVGPFLNVATGTLSGLTLTPGIYTWTSDVNIPNNLTLSGGPNDVWIFQISGNLNTATSTNIVLTGGAQAGNVFWVVAGQTTIATSTTFNGNILDLLGITLHSGVTLNGRALSQTAVNLNQDTINIPNPAPSQITAFNFSMATGTIDQINHTILVTVPNGTNVATLTPTITITGASVQPNSGLAQNFSSPIKYVVSASDGTITNYTVTVAILPSGGGGGGGGGGSSSGGGGGGTQAFCQSVVFGAWKPAIGPIQYRDVLDRTPFFCALTPEQQAATSMLVGGGEITQPTESGNTPTTGVLGTIKYKVGALLRGENNRIYVVTANSLKYITTLSELAEYKGPIINVSDSIIRGFSTNNISTSTATIIKTYPNGTLLRNMDNQKIYVVKNNSLIHISSLAELAKYKNKTINVPNSAIVNYLEMKYPDGTLVRAINDTKIYVITEGKKIHIKSLGELQKYRSKILNILKSELDALN